MKESKMVVARRCALRWLDAAPVTWEKKVDPCPPELLMDLSACLDGIIQRAARLSGYMDARGGMGDRDHGHAAGVKSSNLMASKVRKALGYTYPRQDINF